MRNPDKPSTKDAIMAQLSGEIIGHLKSIGLRYDDDFIMKTIQKFECSTRVVYVDGINDEKQVVIALHSIGMDVEYGVSYKNNPPVGYEKVIKRRKIENLRYNISDGTEPELTHGSRNQFDDIWNEIKEAINSLL